VRDEPADVHRDDEVDHGIVAEGREPLPLDLEPTIRRHRPDLVVVVLAVAAIVQGDTGDETLERQGKRLVPA